MQANRLYILVTALLLLGYSWLFLFGTALQNTGFTPCLFKNCTGLACPSCGTTRSVSQVFKGNIISGILINPLGLVVAAVMIILPFWIIYDIAFKKNSLPQAYKATEKIINTKPSAILLILLLAANWAWNIYKGL